MKAALFFVLAAVSVSLAGEFTVTVPFDRADVKIGREGLFTSVHIPGMPSIFTEGMPALPVMPVRVAVPTGCSVMGLEVVSQSWERLSGRYEVQPASGCVPISAGHTQVQALPDPGVYTRDQWFPLEAAQLASSSVYWGIPTAYVNVHPVRWNPVNGTMEILSSMELRFRYTEDESVRLVQRRTGASEALAMDITRRLVVNPEGVSGSGAALVEPGDLVWGQYVIISHPDYVGEAQQLADWKTAKGIPASVYTTDWIAARYSLADIQQEIRAFLTECRDQGTDYVLIFGDDDKVPCRQAKFVGDASFSTIGATDLYYVDINDTAPGADLWDSNGNGIYGEVPYPYQAPQPAGWDQVDYHPDLWVGRASVNSVPEAQIFLEKVFLYEGIATRDYFTTAPRELRVGYTTGILWHSPYIPGSASAESISTFVPSIEWEEEKLYESAGTNSYQLTIQMIDAGPHHVYHASHGSETYMWTSMYSNYTVDHIMAQTNIASGHLPAIWQSISCLIGHLDGYECCGDAWLNAPDGGGFGCFNSRYGFGNFAGPCKGPSEMLCIRFYQDHWETDIYQFGIAHGTSMDFYSPPDSIYMDWCLKSYNLFGDPELPMWTEVPEDLSVSHPASIGSTGPVTVTVTASGSPVANARVTLQKGHWQTGEIYQVGYTDASGQATLYADPATTGEIGVTVWARNHYTYMGEIEVTGTDVSSTSTLVDSFAFGPVTPNPARDTAALAFSLPSAARVTIEVFDLGGRKVATVLDGDMLPGSHSLMWGLTDQRGREVPTGIYHVRMTTPGYTSVHPVMVIH